MTLKENDYFYTQRRAKLLGMNIQIIFCVITWWIKTDFWNLKYNEQYQGPFFPQNILESILIESMFLFSNKNCKCDKNEVFPKTRPWSFHSDN